MKKRMSMMIGITLLAVAIGFVVYAIHHPEAAFPWSNKITFMLYGMYIWLLFKFLVVIPLVSNDRETKTNRCLLYAVIYLSMAVVFCVMEITSETVDIFTIVRGFIVMGGIDIGVSNLYSEWSR